MEPRQQPVLVLSGLLLAPEIALRRPSHIAEGDIRCPQGR